MKFGAQLNSSRYDDWAPHYLDYSGLKKELKRRLKDGAEWDDADEAEFVGRLLSELGKVSRFQKRKMDEVQAEIDHFKSEVAGLQEDEKRARDEELAGGDSTDGETDDGDGTARTYMLAGIDETYDDLDEQMQTTIADVFELSKYTHLNYTGFVKIVKKHDKRTGWELRKDFMGRHLQKAPFYRASYDGLIVQLSKLYNIIHTHGNPVKGDSAAGGGQTAFVRSTTKYWVHPDNYVNLKLAVLRQLPVLQFKEKAVFNPADAAISSIYFDNPDLELYIGRLEKTQGALAIRLRWYGGMDNKQIFVERKTHREDWTGEKSVKDRFPIEEHNVDAYLRGEYIMDDDAYLKKQSKTPADHKAYVKMAREVQEAIKTMHLRPVMRTFYNRTAFQQPGDARVRISFDTNLTLVREEDFDGVSRAGAHWRRMDIGIDWPFDQLGDTDKHLFPYGVLEVKLALKEGEQTPDWVTQLVDSHLVEAVPKFSKFIHGCATLLPDRVDLVPFWLPQMDIDIRKPINEKQKAALIQRPATTSGSGSSPHKPSSDTTSFGEAPGYTEPLSDNDDDGAADEDLMHPAHDESGVVGLPPEAHAQAQEARAHRQRVTEAEKHRRSSLQPDGKDSPTANVSMAGVAKLTPHNLRMLLRAKQEGLDSVADANDEGDLDPEASQTVMVSSFRAPPGKKVAGKVRIEPKVYFANERTFLGWTDFSVLISAIGVGILNFVPESDPVGLAAGIALTVVALLAILYSTGMFYWRAIMIRNRRAVRYDDRLGPTLLVAILVIALLGNVIFRFTEGPHHAARGPRRTFVSLQQSNVSFHFDPIPLTHNAGAQIVEKV